MSARRKPEKIQIGHSQINRSDLEGLQWAWREKSLVLFLGAGVSLDYGIPTWKNLVLEILFDQTDLASRLESIELHYRRALASWLVDEFDYDPVILARLVKNEIRRRAKRQPAGLKKNEQIQFLEKVRERLYPKPPVVPQGYTSLRAVADLIRKSTEETGVAAAVTFNFDDLLEKELSGSLQVQPVSNPRRNREPGFPILHPHGYLPQDGSLENCSLVFTEDDYHSLTTTVFHWALTAIVHYLRHNTVLFVGLSMSDPSLRRLLHASYVSGDIPAHWQVQKRHKIEPKRMREVRTNIEGRAQQYAEKLNLHFQKDQPQLEEAVAAILKQADTYDRNLFESMGVKTIWLEDWSNLPALLEQIPAG
jgi:hypothetical protein